MNNLKKFMLTLFIGAAALIAQFGFRQPQIAFWLILLVGGLTAISMLIGMIQTLKSGRYGVDILAITAIIATLAVREYWASLMILVMLTGGDSLEDYAGKQANRELQSLLDHSPQDAHKVVGQEITDIAVEDVEVNDLILIKPGELVPTDGRITKGSSSFDESSLTGESVPLEKTVNDELMSGSINGDSAVEYRVTKKASDSQYQTLVKLVKESKAHPARFVRLADQYAVPFTIIAYFIGGIAWFLSKDPVRFAEVLVVASPCPLILAAPIALVAGMSRSSKNGIVVKSGTTIEKLARSKTIAFDKTGTITKGQLYVEKIIPASDNINTDTLLQLAASAELESSHILARSLVAYAKKQQIALLPVKNLEEITGEGIKAEVDNKIIRAGKAELAGLPNQKASDHTEIFISINNSYAGSIAFKDIIRPETKETVSRLRQMGLQRVLMLTGDHQSIAKQIADQVDITEIHSDCLPEDKITILRNLPENDHPSIMVGDGVNDAPALAVADTGIAMGARGSTAASESADAVILKDDLSRVAEAVAISKNTMKIARQSVLIGLFTCIFLMLLASTGIIPALLGAVLQELVDTLSILSALRAKNNR